MFKCRCRSFVIIAKSENFKSPTCLLHNPTNFLHNPTNTFYSCDPICLEQNWRFKQQYPGLKPQNKLSHHPFWSGNVHLHIMVCLVNLRNMKGIAWRSWLSWSKILMLRWHEFLIKITSIVQKNVYCRYSTARRRHLDQKACVFIWVMRCWRLVQSLILGRPNQKIQQVMDQRWHKP